MDTPQRRTSSYYERFTGPARDVMRLANEESQRLHHEYLGADDLLLGLIKQECSVAVGFLKNQHVDLEELCRQVEELTQDRTEMITVGKRPLTPDAKKIIEYAMEEQRNLGHSHVGTSHLLLGILRAQAGVTGRMLGNANLNLDDIRAIPQTEPGWHQPH